MNDSDNYKWRLVKLDNNKYVLSNIHKPELLFAENGTQFYFLKIDKMTEYLEAKALQDQNSEAFQNNDNLKIPNNATWTPSYDEYVREQYFRYNKCKSEMSFGDLTLTAQTQQQLNAAVVSTTKLQNSRKRGLNSDLNTIFNAVDTNNNNNNNNNKCENIQINLHLSDLMDGNFNIQTPTQTLTPTSIPTPIQTPTPTTSIPIPTQTQTPTTENNNLGESQEFNQELLSELASFLSETTQANTGSQNQNQNQNQSNTGVKIKIKIKTNQIQEVKIKIKICFTNQIQEVKIKIKTNQIQEAKIKIKTNQIQETKINP